MRDFDIVILDLLSVPANVDWNRFRKILDVYVLDGIVSVGGAIFVIGDPRFEITGDDLDEPFLCWAPMHFEWDDQPGDTVEISRDWNHRMFVRYLEHLKHWDYALSRCSLDGEALRLIFNMDAIEKNSRRVRLQHHALAWNRYKEDLAFSLSIVVERSSWRHNSEWWEVEHQYGPITFLPKISLTEDEAIVSVLGDICEVEAGTPEPDWLATYEVPGQAQIDAEVASIEGRIASAQDELQAVLEKRDAARQCLKLLYERGQPLETVVRNVFRELGASVEDPKETGKEDGWLSVVVGQITYEGVLEVKSTKNDEFDEYGLKQLLEWIFRGTQLRQKKYKGVFVGSNSVDKPLAERKPGFGDAWKKSCELQEIAALRTEDLYNLYVLSKSGQLNLEAFWQRFFTTDGIFEIDDFLPRGKGTI